MPLLYSQGFNPRPQLQLAAALPLGFSSSCELLDIFLSESISSPPQFLQRVNSKCPEGLFAERIDAVESKSPALQALTQAATYHVCVDTVDDVSKLNMKVMELLKQSEIKRTRRGKAYDLRPLIYGAKVINSERNCLELELALSQAHGTGRPDEVVSELGFDPAQTRVSRVKISYGTVYVNGKPQNP